MSRGYIRRVFDEAWQNRNKIAPGRYPGRDYRRAGEALSTEEFAQAYDNTLQAAKDAFGERYAVTGDGTQVSIGSPLPMPGLTNQQQAINQILKEERVAAGNEFERQYELTPNALNKALVLGADLGIIRRPSITRVISGGEAKIADWKGKAAHKKLGQTGQELASGIDVLIGGPIFSDKYDMGHIYPKNKYPAMQSYPTNTRAESNVESIGYQDFTGEDLLSVVQNRLYGTGDNSTAVRLGQERATPEQLATIDAEAVRAGRPNQADRNRRFAAIGQEVIDDLKGTISLQKIIDSLPYDQQQKAIEALPDNLF